MMPMMMGMSSWWVFPLMGMSPVAIVVLLGAYRILVGPKQPSSNQPDRDPLSIARERYARGEISQRDFDQLVENLVRTEPSP